MSPFLFFVRNKLPHFPSTRYSPDPWQVTEIFWFHIKPTRTPFRLLGHSPMSTPPTPPVLPPAVAICAYFEPALWPQLISTENLRDHRVVLSALLAHRAIYPSTAPAQAAPAPVPRLDLAAPEFVQHRANLTPGTPSLSLSLVSVSIVLFFS